MTDRAARVLTTDNRVALEGFLSERADTSSVLWSNLSDGGIEDNEERGQGTYAGTFDSGELVSVAAHYWTGMLVLQAPVNTYETAGVAMESSGRTLHGLMGPREQVLAVENEFELTRLPTTYRQRERLLGRRLRLTGGPIQENVSGRVAGAQDLPMILEWRARGLAEALGLGNNPKAFSFVAGALQESVKKGWIYIHLEDGHPAGMSTISARVPEHARLGAAWVPEYASDGARKRSAHGHLKLLAEHGVLSVVVGIEHEDEETQDLYASLGFQLRGEHEIIQYSGQ